MVDTEGMHFHVPDFATLRAADLTRLDAVDFIDPKRWGFGIGANWTPERAGESLANLGFGFYHVAKQDYLVGILSDRIHEHDRWLYFLEAPGTGFEGCFKVLPEEHGLDALDYQDSDYMNRLTQLLGETMMVGGDVKDRLGDVNYFDVMGLINMLGFEAVRRMPSILVAQLLGNMPELHTLIHHYPTWQQANPEAVGLSRDLTLRMHGFGDVLSYLPTGANSW